MVNILTKSGGCIIYIPRNVRRAQRRQKESQKTNPNMRLRRAKGTWYIKEDELPGVLDEYIKAYAMRKEQKRGKNGVSELVNRTKKGDRIAKEKLFEHYFYLVVKKAEEYRILGLDFNEAVQVGCEALADVLNSKNINPLQLSARVETNITRYILKNEIGAELLPIEALEGRVESEDPVYMQLEPAFLREHYDRMFNKVAEEQVKVIKMRIFEERTLEQAGEELKLTGERVRQLEIKAMKRLRHPALNRTIRSFMYEEF